MCTSYFTVPLKLVHFKISFCNVFSKTEENVSLEILSHLQMLPEQFQFVKCTTGFLRAWLYHTCQIISCVKFV